MLNGNLKDNNFPLCVLKSTERKLLKKFLELTNFLRQSINFSLKEETYDIFNFPDLSVSRKKSLLISIETINPTNSNKLN